MAARQLLVEVVGYVGDISLPNQPDHFQEGIVTLRPPRQVLAHGVAQELGHGNPITAGQLVEDVSPPGL